MRGQRVWEFEGKILVCPDVVGPATVRGASIRILGVVGVWAILSISATTFHHILGKAEVHTNPVRTIVFVPTLARVAFQARPHLGANPNTVSLLD